MVDLGDRFSGAAAGLMCVPAEVSDVHKLCYRIRYSGCALHVRNEAMTLDEPRSTSDAHTEVSTFNMSDIADTDQDAAPQDPLISRNSEENHTNAPATPSGANLFVWALTISAGVSGLLFGYDTGVISSTLVSIGTDLSSRTLTVLDKGLITSCTSLFALVASPVAGHLADRFGRKNVMLFSDALFTVGALWQAVTTTVWGMVLGRSIVGLAIGGASLITPLYISELAPGHLRGRLVTVSSMLITGGQVVAYVVGWLFSSTSSGWRWMVGLGALPSLAQLILLFFMPETPRHLARIGDEDKARIILRKVYKGTPRRTDIANNILTAIKKELVEEEEAKAEVSASSKKSLLPSTLGSLLFHAPHRRALTLACLLQGLQQLCGFNSLMYFSATIFDLLQFTSPTLTSLSIAVTNFLFTVVAFYAIDRIGRRRILLLTIPVMIVGLLLCSLSFTFVHLPDGSGTTSAPSDTKGPPRSRVPAISILVSLILFVSSYATGLGNVPWQQSELFPLSVRSLGSAIATSTNWGSNTIVGLTFLPLMQAVTPGWTFVLYAVVCAVGWIAVWCIYPETAGLDLEDVGEILKNGWGVKESQERLNKARRNRHER